MTNDPAESPDERLTRLESRLAWLEETVATLDAAASRQERVINEMRQTLAALRESSPEQARNLEDRPPHW